MTATFLYFCLSLIFLNVVFSVLFLISTELEPYEERNTKSETIRKMIVWFSSKALIAVTAIMIITLPFVITAGA